ncbi:MAG: putative maturation protein [Alehxovirus fundicola]|uniref:Maturation protein n=1 Tax=Leviviridae sp. TaxID=2027243 RepID=A0ABY3SRX1_9VIRU|nr:MAG: putative maturation protein [Leviviridae sp.]
MSSHNHVSLFTGCGKFMVARYREAYHTKDMSDETYEYFNGSSWNTYNRSPPSQVDYYSKCWDERGHRELDNPLTIIKYRGVSDGLNGTVDDGYGTKVRYNNYHPPGFNFLYDGTHVPVSGFPPDGDLATSLIVKSNPNNYGVNGPVSIAELRELPAMLRLLGNVNLLKSLGKTNREISQQLQLTQKLGAETGSLYLSYQFGWKPLMSDLNKLLDFNGSVDKKANEIHNLWKKGGLHRKRSFGMHSNTNEEDIDIFNHNGNKCIVRNRRHTTVEKWGTVRYLPYGLPPKNDAEVRRQAIRVVYGLELSAANIWESLPWSWLIDWFYKVGDFLSQFNNVIPCVPTSPCIMTRTTTQATFARVDNTKYVTGCTGHSTYQTKQRSIVTPSISANLPFLTDRHLSILGSLAIQRFKR